ncbi:hypothetical protein OG758_48325 [Streptomyces sp. NBC_01474]|nr:MULTISPECIES: hypothetical protein [unclassified Streptomyces]WSE01230.1 hypothetical protein OG758_48325 [Streptomyces sp. NBC_01474]
MAMRTFFTCGQVLKARHTLHLSDEGPGEQPLRRRLAVSLV